MNGDVTVIQGRLHTMYVFKLCVRGQTRSAAVAAAPSSDTVPGLRSAPHRLSHPADAETSTEFTIALSVHCCWVWAAACLGLLATAVD
jgi:hypothetical protein